MLVPFRTSRSSALTDHGLQLLHDFTSVQYTCEGLQNLEWACKFSSVYMIYMGPEAPSHQGWKCNFDDCTCNL